MKRARSIGQQGVVLPALLGLVLIILALAGASTLLCTVQLRSSSTSDRMMRAFYVADSGAQVARYELARDGGPLTETSFSEDVAGGSFIATITPDGSGLYSISSVGTYEGEEETVRVQVRFGGFTLNGAVDLAFDDSVELDTDGAAISLRETSVVSGQNHDSSGVPLADQSGAVYGIAMNEVPGGVDLDISTDAGATLAGSPDPTTNEAESHGDAFQALRDHARNNADISISGNRTLGTAQTGSYGTAAAPKLVYVRLYDDDTLTLNGSFVGYGTLVVDMRDADETTVLRLSNGAVWNGLVLVQLRGYADIDSASVVRMENSSRIVGGLGVHFRATDVEIEDGGRILKTSGTAAVRYAGTLVMSAPGVDILGGTGTSVVAYWLE